MALHRARVVAGATQQLVHVCASCTCDHLKFTLDACIEAYRLPGDRAYWHAVINVQGCTLLLLLSTLFRRRRSERV